MRKILINLLLVLFLLPTVLSENRINIESKINLGYNDAYERNGVMYVSGVTIDMGKQSTTLYRGGFRFTNIPLPKGAIIEDAKLSLAYNWASASTNNLLLYGEASDNALQFKTTSKDISNRIKTKSSIIWNNLKKVRWGQYQTSPNISQIIQEIINRPNWNEGNSIVILGYESSNSIWEAISYEGTDWNYGLYSAKLQIIASIPQQCAESWSCTEWSKCINGSQMRECNDMNNCGTTNNKPIEKQDCVCNESWSCTNWSECIPDQEMISVSYYVCNETTRTCIQLFIAPKGTQTRICTDLNDCETENYKPIETLNCTVNLCKDIICNDSELLCPDGFIAACENSCNNFTKSCSNCTPDCTGHEGSYMVGIRCTTASGIQSESSNYLAGATNFVASKFTDSIPSVIYGPGYITDNGIAYLNFPSLGGSYPYIEFASADENEAHLNAFDAMGAKVWLQVEPGRANMLTLIDLVLNQYKHHPSVIGFGVDVEWLEYPIYPEGRKVTDAEATSWVNRIKSHNQNYKLFLKHWETSMMPNNYPVGDVVFISDFEQNGNFNNFLNGFIEWGNTFPDSEVGFQAGYPSDKGWWDDYADPVQYLGNALFDNIPNMKYYYWVDFSIKDVFPPTGDFCKSIVCNDSILICSDGFVSTCENTCDSLTGLCNDCIPSCEGYDTPPSLCKGIICEDSVLVCPDGFISTCTNYCNEENGLCNQCTPTCIGHERISYQEVAYTYKVSSGYDDAYERNGNIYLNGATIDIGSGYYGGFRFNNIQLPKGSIIKDSKLSLAYNWASSSVSNIILYGENSDNAKQFQSTSKDITNRARTKGVTWTNLVKGSWGTYQTSPNISIIIQEITDRTNWKNGSSIAILGYYLSGGIWEAVSYEGTDWNYGLYGAKLEIKVLVPIISINNTNNTNITPPIPSNSTGIILVQLDDTSPEQLDTANLAVEKFHNEGIAITPELWSAGLSTSNLLDIALLWDSWSEVEIAQGVYSGDSCGNSLTNDIRNGKLEYANAGITQPTSYLPHICYPSSSALDDLRDEGILIVIDYASPDVVRNGDPSNPSQQPLTIYDGRDIAEGGLDDYNTILYSVRSQVAEKGYADLAFHVWAIDEPMSNNVITMMKRLRDEEGYTFMTATEYYHSVWG